MGYSKAEKLEYVEERAKKLAQTLEDGIKGLHETQNWKNYLRANALFHNYSFRNILLIALQAPDATRVASFTTWRKMGRSVNKGESGIMIIIPRPFVKKGEDGQPLTNDKGEELKGMAYKTGYIFDISQTSVTNEELWSKADVAPLATVLDFEVDENLLEALGKVSERIGFKFILDDLEGASSTAHGYTTLGEENKEIHVRASNPMAQKIKTAVHELGHALLHASSGDEQSLDGKAHRGIAELEAESVAFIVCDALGMDTSDYSIGYIAGWNEGIKGVEGAKASKSSTGTGTAEEAEKAKLDKDVEVASKIGESVFKTCERIITELNNVAS